MYAIAFDFNTKKLEETYGKPSWQNAYGEVGKVLSEYGFDSEAKQGSVYFAETGNSTVNPITCVLVAQQLARLYPWFAASVRDIRMLRIEENNDLRPAIEQVIGCAYGI